MAQRDDNADTSRPNSDADRGEYELDLPEDQPSAQSSSSEPSKREAKRESQPSSDADAESGTYSLDEAEDADGSPTSGQRLNDPRFDQGDESRAGESMGRSSAEGLAQPSTGVPESGASTPPRDSDRPTSTVYTPEDEPDSIDPEVARMRREDQRQRAAQQQAVDDARRRKRTWIAVAVVVAVVILILLIVNFAL